VAAASERRHPQGRPPRHHGECRRTHVPGLIVYRFDAAPLFFNADYLKQRIRAVVASAPVKPTWFRYSAEAANE
jgi:MFS superfamily sulfate permease-like transporter